MLVRLALESDREALRALGREHVKEITPEDEWDDVRADAVYDRYLDGANPTFFVVERQREVLGYLMARIIDCAFTSGFYVELELIYVKPENRGSRAAACLMAEFHKWTARIKPKTVIVTAANSGISPKTLRFIEKNGYKYVGPVFARDGGAL